MRTIDMMSPRDLQDLRDAGRGHLIDGAGPLIDKADALRTQEREDAAIRRPGRSYSLAIWTLRNGKEEFRVVLGNKIISRHQTEAEAMTALRAALAAGPPQPVAPEAK